MDRLTPELEWLKELSMDPLPAWQEYAKSKGDSLAEREPEDFKTLPKLLQANFDKTKQGPPRSLRPSTQQQQSTEGVNDGRNPCSRVRHGSAQDASQA